MQYSLYTTCVCSSIELQLGSYIHTCTNETHSLAPLQDLIPILWQTTFIAVHHDAKVGIKSCRGATEYVSFVHVCICSYPAAILYLSRHMQYTMNAEWVVSDSYIASYLFPYFLCRSLLPFLNSKLFRSLV